MTLGGWRKVLKISKAKPKCALLLVLLIFMSIALCAFRRKHEKNRQRLEEEIYGKQKIKTYLLLLLLFMRTSSRAPPVPRRPYIHPYTQRHIQTQLKFVAHHSDGPRWFSSYSAEFLGQKAKKKLGVYLKSLDFWLKFERVFMCVLLLRRGSAWPHATVYFHSAFSHK